MKDKYCVNCRKFLGPYATSRDSETYGFHDISSERRGGKPDGWGGIKGGRTFDIHFDLCYECLESGEHDFEL